MPEWLPLTIALYLPLSRHVSSHCIRGRDTAQYRAIPDVQELTAFVVETHKQSKHGEIRGNKGRHPEEGIPGVLRESLLCLIIKEGGREGFGHKGRDKWPPSFLNPAVGQR